VRQATAAAAQKLKDEVRAKEEKAQLKQMELIREAAVEYMRLEFGAAAKKTHPFGIVGAP